MNEIREQRRTKIPGQILQGFSASKNGFEAFFGGANTKCSKLLFLILPEEQKTTDA